MNIWKLNNKQLSLTAIFGGMALTLRLINLYIPIGGPFIIDLRGIPGVIGAALSGPIGGLIIGILAGIPAKYPIVDIPSFSAAYFFTGLISYKIKRMRWISGLSVTIGYLIAPFIVWQMGLTPTYYFAIVLLAPRMIMIPVLIFILFIIFNRIPNIIENIV